MQLCAKILNGEDEGKEFPLCEGLLGSGIVCETRLTDPRIAPVHARLSIRSGSVYITDLSNKVDLYVNGTAVKSRKLQSGDKLSISGINMEITDASQECFCPAEEEEDTILLTSEQASPTARRTVEPTPDPQTTLPPHRVAAQTAAASTPPPSVSPTPKTEKGKATKVFVVALIILVVLAPIITAIIYQTSRKAEQKRMTAEFTRIQQYAVMYNDKIEDAIKDYRQLHILTKDEYPRIAALASEEIKKLESKLATQKTTLVAQSTAHSPQAQDEWSSAEKEPYDKLDTDHIPPESLKSNQKLDEFLNSVADAAVRGNATGAIAAINDIINDASMEQFHNRARDVAAALALLENFDRSIAEGKEILPEQQEAAPVLVKAILALRKNQFLQAQSFLRRIPQNLLYEKLAAKIAISDENRLIEKRAMQDFAKVWSALVGEETTSIPKPVDCITIMQNIAAGHENQNLPELCDAFINVQKQFDGSIFVETFKHFFAQCKAIQISLQKTLIPGTYFGDYRIIERDGATCFLEFGPVAPDPATAMVGIFEETDIFYNKDLTDIVAARINVIATLPFKMVADNQATFELPEGITAVPIGVGSSVLLRQDIKPGTMILTSDQSGARTTLYNTDFSKSVPNDIKPILSSLAVKNGALAVTRAGHAQDTLSFGISANVAIKWQPFRMSVDLARNSKAPFKIKIDKLIEIILPYSSSTPYPEPGIYCNGHLIKTIHAAVPHSDQRQTVTISIDDYTIDLTMPSFNTSLQREFSSIGDDIQTISLISQEPFTLYSLRANDLSLLRSAQIIGITKDRYQIALQMYGASEWSDTQLSSPIYIVTRKEGALSSSAAFFSPYLVETGIVKEIFGNYITAQMNEPIELITPLTIASKNPQPQDIVRVDQAECFLLGQEWMPPVFSARIVANRFIKPDVPVKTGRNGFIGAVEEILLHPFSREPLTVIAPPLIPAEFTQRQGLLQSPSLPKIAPMGSLPSTLLVSQKSILPNSKIDLAGFTRVLQPMPTSRGIDGWILSQGTWKTHMNRLHTEILPNAPAPVISMGIIPYDNVQIDIDVRVERTTVKESNEILVDLQIPVKESGICFELGSSGIVPTLSRIIQKAGNHTITDKSLARPALVKWDFPFNQKVPVLKKEQFYAIRIRRIEDSFALYVNGKRICVSTAADNHGDLSVKIAAIGGAISIGRCKIMSLSSQTIIPETEPDCGEFGYVLSATGQSIIVDSDMQGLQPNSRVTVMKIDKVIKGDISRSIMLSRAASGVVTEIGTRTARISLISQFIPVEQGMKVMKDSQPESLTITSASLANLEEAL